MRGGSDDQKVLDLLTQDSYHRKITVIYMTQDMFPKGKFAKKHFEECSLYYRIQESSRSIGSTYSYATGISSRIQRCAQRI